MDQDGRITPATGTISALELPSGPGVRVDGTGYAGYAASPSFDSLLAKLIVHSTSADFAEAVKKARRALARISRRGRRDQSRVVARTSPPIRGSRPTTSTPTFIEEHAAELARGSAAAQAVFRAG